MISIFTFDYNSRELTDAFLKSVFKNDSLRGKIGEITVFSNCKENPFNTDIELEIPVKIAYDSIDIQFSRPIPDNQHSYSIQKAVETSKNDNILICDCDILLKPNSNILELIDESVVTSGHFVKYPNENLNRIHPCLQYINRKILTDNIITFYNGHTHATGDCFYKQIKEKNLPIKIINYNDYCHHLRISTYNNGNSESHFSPEIHQEFLKKYEYCWK